MATPRSLLRITTNVSKSLRPFSTTTTTATAITTDVAAADGSDTNHSRPPVDHTFLEPNPYIGSWKPPKNPKEAQARLDYLRRDYAKQVKELRKQYIQEMEELRLEKQRKDEARREAIRIAKEERKKLKAEAAKVRAEERKVAQAQFLELLLKERAEKLENWRAKEKERKELEQKKLAELRQKSSIWIEESELESKIKEAVVDSSSL